MTTHCLENNSVRCNTCKHFTGDNFDCLCVGTCELGVKFTSNDGKITTVKGSALAHGFSFTDALTSLSCCYYSEDIFVGYDIQEEDIKQYRKAVALRNWLHTVKSYNKFVKRNYLKRD